MLKPPGKAFARVAVASTLCHGCSQRIEHPTNYTISSVQSDTPKGMRTKLLANQTLVIHVCTTIGHHSSTRVAVPTPASAVGERVPDRNDNIDP
jgi:hypothetical protein